MKRNYIAASILASSVMLLAPVSAFAQTPNPNQPAAQQKTSDKCQKIEKHISDRTQKLANRIKKSEQTYDKNDNKVQDILQKAKAKGIDTVKAEADLQTWKDQTAQLKSARRSLVDKLNDSKQFECGKSDGKFKDALKDAQAQLAKVKEIQKDKQSFFKNSLKPDLKSIREQLKNKK